jgi:hypothetical protein
LQASKSQQIEREREREREREWEREKMKGGGIEPGCVVKKEKIMCNLRFGVKVWADRESNSGIGLLRNFNFMGSLKLIRATRRWW